MPARFAALLGGVNVGGHRVTMDRLRDVVTGLGFTEVSTFIASGNVMLSAAPSDSEAAIARRLSEGLPAALGWPTPCYVRTAEHLVETASFRPFGEVAEGTTHMVVFCSDPLDRSLDGDLPGGEQFVVRGRELHWFIPGGLMTSTLTLPKLATRLGQPCTTRNSTTLRKWAAVVNAR
jgi:uncharacterized protein (DUF1697 family)